MQGPHNVLVFDGIRCRTDRAMQKCIKMRTCVQLLLHSLQKSVERAPLDVEEVAAAAEARSIAKPDAREVLRSHPTIGCFLGL